MKLRLSSILPLIVLSGALYAQAPDRAGGGDKETTMQGCLTKDAANQSQYVLRDDKTNATTMVSGSPDLLEKHNNHTVKLTGAETTENGQRVFKVVKLDHISASCTAGRG